MNTKYYNDNYKCPICNKYILCYNSPCFLYSDNIYRNYPCSSCLHNKMINKDHCKCTIDMYITHINMLRDSLLESNHYAAYYYTFIGD